MVPSFALAEFLADLRGRGLSVGVREHLAVGRLLARFDAADLDTLRSALASLLARNPIEAQLVRETFDRHYAATAQTRPPPPPPPLTLPRWWTWERLSQEWTSFRTRLRLRWIAWAAGLIVVATLTGLAVHLLVLPGPISVPPPPPGVPHDDSMPVLDFPTPPPLVNWTRAALAAAGVATLVFLALYVVRTRQEAGRRGRGRWGAESSLLSGPRDYELRIDVPLSPVRGQDLDDVATMLGRRVAINERGRQLDVDRTLDRTLSAGLAPQLALRAPRAATSIVVLEDASESMRRYRFIVRHVLNGLEARGVVLDQWRFDTDGSRVWRASDRVSISLKQLLRLRGENAILILSDGLGVLDGATLRVAPWVHMLRGWRSRAWVHPLSDRVYWHPGLGRVPCEVRPMTASGLLAAARDLARADLRSPMFSAPEAPTERPVVPLDVERLRWLLTLTQRREPELAELLRQRFCPNVPPAAVAEALIAPPRVEPPPVGPTATEVRSFFLELLDTSRPEPGTMAFERWRLDRAIQAIHLDALRNDGLDELAALAQGPLAADVEDRLTQMGFPGAPNAHRFTRQPLPTLTAAALEASVIRPIARRARREGFTDQGGVGRGGYRWTLPSLSELATCAVTAAVVLASSPWMGALVVDRVPATLWTYDLTLMEQGGSDEVQLNLTRRPEAKGDAARAPDDVELFRAGKALRGLKLDRSGIARYTPSPEERGEYFHAQATLASGTIALSQLVRVPAASPPSVVPKLIGMTASEAENALAAATLRLGKVERRVEANAAPSRLPEVVVAQSLPAGEGARAGTEIDVVVAVPKLPSPPINVPDLRGLMLPQARKVLAGANLKLGTVTRMNTSGRTLNKADGPALDTILGQEPPPGKNVLARSTVNVEVQGYVPPPPVSVPMVIGMTVLEAEKRLAAAGLKLGEVVRTKRVPTISQDPRQAAPGTIVAQRPDPGATVPDQSTVSVEVAGEPDAPKVPVPRLDGLTVTEAEKALAGVNLKLGQVVRRSGPEQQQNPPLSQDMLEVVSDQKPTPGEMVLEGIAVDVRVEASTGPTMIVDAEVPDLIGRTLPQARAMLIKAGLTLGVVEHRKGVRKAGAPDTSSEVVVDQKPLPGVRVPKGTAVDVVVQVESTARPGAGAGA